MILRMWQLILVVILAGVMLGGAVFAQNDSNLTVVNSVEASSDATDAPEKIAHKAVVVQLEGEINDYSYRDLVRRFRIASEMGATAIILEIDSYGGLVTAGLETSYFIKQQEMPVYAFIEARAISAGAMIALACNGLYMGPHSLLGDAAPIMMSPTGEDVGEVMRAKIESPVVEDFRDSAIRNGYSTLLLESMVILGVDVYYVQNEQGESRFVNGESWDTLEEEGGWTPVIPDRHPIDSETTLLTVNATVGTTLGLSRGIKRSSEEVAADLGWTIIGRLDRTAGDRLIALLGSIQVRGLLTTGLLIAIYMAIRTPGTGFPEATVVICLAVLLGVPMLTGYAQWWEIALVLLGIGLIAVELFVLPGFGIIGLSGLALIFGGLVMTFVPREPVEIPGILPQLVGTRQAIQDGLLVVLISMSAAMVIISLLIRMLPQIPVFGRLVLTTTVGGNTIRSDWPPRASEASAGNNAELGVRSSSSKNPGDLLPEPTAVPAMAKIGDTGVVLTDLRPGGTVRFDERLANGLRTLDVVCDSGFIPIGARVRVHQVQGGTIVVRRIR